MVKPTASGCALFISFSCGFVKKNINKKRTANNFSRDGSLFHSREKAHLAWSMVAGFHRAGMFPQVGLGYRAGVYSIG
jgi:hypothetical protein